MDYNGVCLLGNRLQENNNVSIARGAQVYVQVLKSVLVDLYNCWASANAG